MSPARLWIPVLSGVLTVVLGVAAILGLEWMMADRRAPAVTTAQANVVVSAFEATAGFAAEVRRARGAFLEARSGWEADAAWIARWLEEDAAPEPQVPNPGGQALPGDDPYGRAFLDSIGATDVQVIFDAGAENCGYAGQEDGPGTLVVGGCYQTAYPDWLFVAWEPGIERLAWPLFVHEAMHWYQYRTYFPYLRAADRAGISESEYDAALERDASCRAVYLHGIDRSAYAGSSSPCDLDDWYDGWFVDQLIALGVRTSAPTSEEFEVSAVVRP